jgi:hypothetical protein
VGALEPLHRIALDRLAPPREVERTRQKQCPSARREHIPLYHLCEELVPAAKRARELGHSAASRAERVPVEGWVAKEHAWRVATPALTRDADGVEERRVHRRFEDAIARSADALAPDSVQLALENVFSG